LCPVASGVAFVRTGSGPEALLSTPFADELT
jgi:hypothetical protein